jgi:calcium-dependent protein kinase
MGLASSRHPVSAGTAAIVGSDELRRRKISPRNIDSAFRTDTEAEPVPMSELPTIRQRLSNIRRKSCKEFPIWYQTRNDLGEGISGHINKVRDIHGRERASKGSYGYERPNKPQILELKQELRLLQRLDHPNVSRLIEAFEDPTSMKLILEVCKGGNLGSASGRARLRTEANITAVLYQIFLALEYVHSLGIGHRDIKQENILFVSSNPQSLHVQVIDFALSSSGQNFDRGSRSYFRKYTESIHHLNTFCGTLPYMSPEVLVQDYDLQADLWSMGVLIFEIITGTLPFQGKSDRNLIKNIRKAKIDYSAPIWKSFSPHALEMVQNLLIVPASKRWTAKRSLQSPWFQATRLNLERDLDSDQEFTTLLCNSLRNFGSSHGLNKLVLLTLAHFAPIAPEEFMEKLRKVFTAVDYNCDGVITFDEFEQLFSEVAKPKSPQSPIPMNVTFKSPSNDPLHILFSNIDYDSMGEITWTCFVAATMESFRQLGEVDIAKAFDYLAGDRHEMKISHLLDVACGGNSSILRNVRDVDSTNVVISVQSNNNDPAVRRADLQRRLEEVDSNRDGTLNKQEFVNAVKQAGSLQLVQPQPYVTEIQLT